MVGIHFTAYLMYIFISFLWFYHHSSAFFMVVSANLEPKSYNQAAQFEEW